MTGEDGLEILETNLIPAVVPDSRNLLHVVSEQPRLKKSANKEDKTIHHYNRRNHNQNPEGLARLSFAEEITINLESSFFRCFNSSAKYFIRDGSSQEGEDSLIFEAAESSSCCAFGNLRNVVIRNREDVPVARACFKEKNFLLKSLVLAVYAPPESLIGTVEESPSCFVFSSEFILGNAEGGHLFRINFDDGFTVTLLENTENEQQAAQIIEKTKSSIRLKFLSKLSITNKLILLGWCLGVMDKGLHQGIKHSIKV